MRDVRLDRNLDEFEPGTEQAGAEEEGQGTVTAADLPSGIQMAMLNHCVGFLTAGVCGPWASANTSH